MSMPQCLIIPDPTGSISNCMQVKLPSVATIIFLLVISWAIILLIAYGIYWFLNKHHPKARYSYWVILLILIVALIVSTIISGLISKLG